MEDNENGEYTLTTIVPEQTVTPNESRMATPEDEFSLEEGKFYLVTLDDDEYLTTCSTIWTDNNVIGDANIIFEVSQNSISYPFCAIATDEAYEIYFVDTDPHTIKIEMFEFESTENDDSGGVPNNFIGYSLPVVNEGPWSYFESDGSGRIIEVQNPGPWSNFIIEDSTPSDTAVVGTAIVGTAKAA